ncbi:hypothetical protein Goari_010423, partial [Gossypium aridum]|nr:hypothetical protein [Gossypium aridum]
MSITRECRKGKARNKECQHLLPSLRTRSSPTSPHLAHNWVHLNTNGSIKIEDDFAAVGSLVQECNSEWIFNLYRYLGCNVLEAELCGILDGLNLSLDQGFKYILIQTDSCKAVNAIQEAFSFIGAFNIPRDENKFADSLVKMVRDKRTRLHLLEDLRLR